MADELIEKALKICEELREEYLKIKEPKAIVAIYAEACDEIQTGKDTGNFGEIIKGNIRRVAIKEAMKQWKRTEE